MLHQPDQFLHVYGNMVCFLHREKHHRLVASCQCCRLVVTCKQVTTNLSISWSWNRSIKIRLVATCHLQTYSNLLKQLAASLWITSFDNQLAISLLTTCNRLVVNKLSQAVRTHPDIEIDIGFQDANRLFVTCSFLAVHKVSYVGFKCLS